MRRQIKKSSQRISRPKQQELIGLNKSDRARKFTSFGGSLKSGNPRLSRPVSSKHSMHLILKSSLAKGRNAFSHPGRKKQLENLITSQALKQGVRIFELSINSNHIHLLLKPLSRRAYSAFIKAISGLIARKVLNRERGVAKAVNADAPTQPKLRFWDHRPFSRIVGWGRAFYEARFYVIQNVLEAIGYLEYRPRHQKVMKI